MKTILELLKKNVQKFPNKVVFADVEKELTYSQFDVLCKKVASKIISKGMFNQPVAVVDNRDVNTLVAMFAVLYSGNYYVVLDAHSPKDRIKKIYDVLNIKYTFCKQDNLELVGEFGEYEFVENLTNNKIDEQGLSSAEKKVVSTNPAYVLFTSGSTGVPKGTVVSHLSLSSYVEWYETEFNINENTVFGNQLAFTFSASVSDIFSTITSGASFYIIPKMYFAFPIKLVEFLNLHKVNTIYWVPSALCIVANLKLFDYAKPQYLEKVLFVGEVMPNKQLNYWRRNLPNVMYANLYGPTEVVDICTFYVINRPFKDEETLPIGKSCNNADCFIVDENGKQITKEGEVGELLVRSAFVAFGYYDNPEKTKEVFVQNPLNSHYPEIVYRTGDLVKINKYGEFEYVGRKDFQIKHMGYRIELGEIEAVVNAIDGVDNVVCVYDKEEDNIVLIYTGKIKQIDLLEAMKGKLTNYMYPNVVIKVAQMQLNQSGKLDRNFYKNNYKTLK